MLENLIVPVLNRYDLLQRMLSTIDYPIDHILIIDNGSAYRDHTPHLEVNDHVSNVWYLPMPSNLGVSESWNLGIKLFPHHKRWFIVSNDVWFDPGTIQQFADLPHGVFGKASNSPSWQTFIVPDLVIQKVGLWDPNLYPAYFEDNDFERRMEHHGFHPHAVAPVNHENSSTIKSDPELNRRNNDTFQRNRKYYDRKSAAGDVTGGVYDLAIRRANEWLPTL